MSIRDYYNKLFGERGLNTLEDLRSEYKRKRMQILNTIITASPDNYRVNDAHFLIGKIFWDREEYDKALESWRKIKPNKSDMYHDSYMGITDLLKKQGTPSKEEIARVLEQEIRKYSIFMRERVRHFGYFSWEF